MIKFRGKRLSDGETIYGFYHECGGGAYIDDWHVDPKTVAQLCTVDVVKGELYEGDEYIDANGNKCTVIALPAIQNNFTGEVKLFFSRFGDFAEDDYDDD